MKPYYYTFEWKDRVITLCLVLIEKPIDMFGILSMYTIKALYMGYSIKIPEDINNEDFAKSISLGRAKKEKTQYKIGNLEKEFLRDKGVLKAIARNCERNIKNGTIVIKGIR